MRSERNKREGDAFFAENAKKEGVVILPSGLQYKALEQGDGKKPNLDDYVACNYKGTLLDGTEFDSSYKRNQPATLPVKGLIKGWSEALCPWAPSGSSSSPRNLPTERKSWAASGQMLRLSSKWICCPSRTNRRLQPQSKKGAQSMKVVRSLFGISL